MDVANENDSEGEYFLKDNDNIANIYHLPVGVTFSVSNWEILQDKDSQLKHLSAMLWTGKLNDLWLWRCESCYSQGRLPIGPLEEESIQVYHYATFQDLATPRLCEGCSSAPFENRNVSTCWACMSALAEADWDLSVINPNRAIQVRINKVEDIGELGPSSCREVNRDIEPSYSLFFFVDIFFGPFSEPLIIPIEAHNEEDEQELWQDIGGLFNFEESGDSGFSGDVADID